MTTRGSGAEHTALLVMVHGSPRPEANADMLRVVELVRQQAVFCIVVAAFMECNEPSIPTGIDLCAASGATEIVAVPYFLHTGTHVAEDLPTLLDAGRTAFPHITFKLGRYLGCSPHVTEILAQRIEEAT